MSIALLASITPSTLRPGRQPIRLALAWLALVGSGGATLAVATPTSPVAPEMQKLDAVNVNERPYKPVPLDVPRTGLHLLGFSVGPPGSLSPGTMGDFVVTATRTPEPPNRVAATALIFDSATAAAIPSVTVDGLLRTEPSFSLFRRSDSLIANPTTQGVSLRGLGPSGASRSLVLLDGVPLNDPFGGWVLWSKIPRDSIARIEVIPGGGAAAWGNAALGGVIQVFTQPLHTETIVLDRPPNPIAWAQRGTARFTALVGDFDTRSGSFVLTRPAGRSIVQVLGEDFTTEGFSIVAPERRGSIDVPAWNRHRSLAGRWRTAIGQNAEVTVAARSFEEFRGNGTPYQRNGDREKSASVQFAGQPADHFLWTATAYAQDQSFASTFSSVNATRTAETPASDQFAVPAVALGASATGTWSHASEARTNLGIDLRAEHGETRENYSFVKSDFTRQRVAGGSQTIGGIFALHEQPLSSSLRLTLGGRFDRWRDADGHRRETDRATGALLRNDQYANRHGTEFSPTLGLGWNPADRWRVHSNLQQSFRRPTLNELYRPFRQGSNIVETNPDLKTEHATSAEIGAEWTLPAPNQPPPPTAGTAKSRIMPNLKPPPRVAPLLTLGATAFWNDLHDAVSNVTVARGPGTFPLFGTLTAGTTGRQRLNLDRVEVRGAELSADWHPNPVLSLRAAWLYNDAAVRQAGVAPGLVGRRLAEVPNHSATLAGIWHAPAKFTFTPRLRWIGRQWDDDENTLRLGETVVVDCGVSRPVTEHLELFLNVENVCDARVETARSADGVVNTGTPRFAFGGIRGRW